MQGKEQRGQAEILVGKFLSKWEIPKFPQKGNDCLWSPQPPCLPPPEMEHGSGGSVLRLPFYYNPNPVPHNSSHSIPFSCCRAGIIFSRKGLQSSSSPSHPGQVTAVTTAGGTPEKQADTVDVAAKSPPCLPKFLSLLTPQDTSMAQPMPKQPWTATENCSDIKGFQTALLAF